MNERRKLEIGEAVQLGAELQRAGRLADARRLYERVLEIEPDNADARHLLGVVAMQQGERELALKQLLRAIELQPGFAAYHNNLGAAYQSLGRLDEAICAFRRACALEPEFAQAHKNLGGLYGDLGRHEDAATAYRRAIASDPEYAEAYNNLGVALRELGQLAESAEAYEHAIRLRPDYVKAKINLGVTYADLGRFDDAIASYRRALEREPAFAAGWNNLGNALRNTGQHEAAEACFRRALELAPTFASALNNLGNVFNDRERLDDAVASYREAIRCDPDFNEAYRNLGVVLSRRGDVRDAAESFRAARWLRDWPLDELLIESLCPLVFESREAIASYRENLHRHLDRFAAQTFDIEARDITSLAAAPSFNLPFHGEDDRPIKEAYGRVFSRYFPREGPRHAVRARPKIGFVVTHGHEDIFLRSLAGVVKRINRERFEPVIACSPAGTTKVRAWLPERESALLVLPGAFGAIIDTLRAAQFDLLYFWEIAVDWTSYFLPYFRLAPVQCTSWGIQVTSGIPTMDYYLSSALVEVEEADKHYSETLLRAQTLLTYKRRLERPTKVLPRADFGLDDERHVYACPQNLGKLHPDFDPVLAAILRRDPAGVLVIIGDRNPAITEALRRRFARTLGEVAERVVIVPRQEFGAYVSLLLAADVLLDPLHFGGVNTTYDALSFGVPIVTCPSRFQRGRYTLGCYRKMGVMDCVVDNHEAYVDLALRLGTERAFRDATSSRLLAASGALFNDIEAVREHERLFDLMLEPLRR